MKTIERLEVGDLVATDFSIEVGGLDYGFPADGFLGLDFLRTTQAVLDLASLDLSRSAHSAI